MNKVFASALSETFARRCRELSLQVFWLLGWIAILGISHVNAADLDKNTDQLASMPPEVAVREYYRMPKGDQRAVEAALKALKRNPQLPEYYRKRLENDSNSAENWAEIWQIVKDLQALRTEWAVRLLGRMLFDDRDVILPKGITFEQLSQLDGSSLQTMPYRMRAVHALQELNLPGTPYKSTDIPWSGQNRIETWRSWWKANEAAIPALLQDDPQRATPDNVTPSEAPKTAATAVGAKTPQTVATSGNKQSGYLVAICSALVGIAVVVIFLRKRAKRYPHDS